MPADNFEPGRLVDTQPSWGSPGSLRASECRQKNVGVVEQSGSELSGRNVPSLYQPLRPEESAATRRRPGSSRVCVSTPRDFNNSVSKMLFDTLAPSGAEADTPEGV